VLRGGEAAARRRLQRFLSGAGSRYETGRDRMDRDGTSRLSADLKFGTLSVRTVWQAASRRLGGAARDAFLNELVWREFMHHTIADHPDLASEPFRAEFRDFPWLSPRAGAATTTASWNAWIKGRTGYPIVDASARQLNAEGFVHNRARMISASFLTKHLLIDYRFGERHYMQLLTDGDWANNNGGWQWAAGCGADAQPYFRVFNPVTQGQRFDPTGAYVRRWIPELARLPDKYLHAPWSAPPDTLRAAGIVLGRDYPCPIVDHADARAHFLDVATSHLRARRRVSAESRG
jgi:deoxyribodipyrimidine photo-lyase